MELAVTFTVNNRPDYFLRTLNTWSTVRGIKEHYFIFNCEPVLGGQCAEMAHDWLEKNNVPGPAILNSEKFGVGHSPYMALSRAFEHGAEYAVLAEDDLLVSDDILEYHLWAAETYKNNKQIATVCSFSEENSDRPADVKLSTGFPYPLIWGTWRDRWEEYIGPTWDHNYNTYTDYPGNQSGFDWNLNLRVLPTLGKYSLQPSVSRVQNIGAVGTHSPEGAFYVTSPVFQSHREPVEYIVVTG